MRLRVLSEIYPIIGSVMASHTVPTAMTAPITEGLTPITVTPKKSMYEEKVLTTSEYPKSPRPSENFWKPVTIRFCFSAGLFIVRLYHSKI